MARINRGRRERRNLQTLEKILSENEKYRKPMKNKLFDFETFL